MNLPFLRVRATTGALCLSLLLASVVGCDPARAARQFPQNSRQVKVTAVADDAIVADGDTYHLAPGVLVFNPGNMTIVRGQLPAGTIVRIQTDLNGDVRRIWILADDEILTRPWWQFWRRSQPQADTAQPVPTN